MFERYTERARRVIFWARYMASRLESPEIEPEHLLLGLLREDMSLASRFLGSPWAVEAVWKEVERNKEHIKRSGAVDLPLSDSAKRVLAFATKEVDRLSKKRVGSEVLFLCLLQEEGSLAAKILHDRGVRLEPSRAELRRVPHDDSKLEEFVRQNAELPESVILLQNRVRSISNRIHDAITSGDFSQTQALSDEEKQARDELYSLCKEEGLLEWLYV
jgi:ATP-dependent Clp protease ATP-binding subunit ClpC